MLSIYVGGPTGKFMLDVIDLSISENGDVRIVRKDEDGQTTEVACSMEELRDRRIWVNWQARPTWGGL